MKFFAVMPIVLVLTSSNVLAQSKHIYADVQVTEITPKNDFIWQRKNQHTPKYPVELARSGTRGCAVLSFDISASGRTENIEIINSVPNQFVGRSSRQMLQKWQWVSTAAAAMPEKRTLRLDFCIGGESLAQAVQICKQQAQLACG